MRPTQCITVLAASLALWHPATVTAQDSGIDVRIAVTSDSYEALTGTPFMVSVLLDGAIVRQGEQTFNNGVGFSLPPGVYDVRIEGDGAITEVKRGITVTEGPRVSIIGGPMRAGEGLHVVEYATGGMTREELAVRLTRMEEALATVLRMLEAVTESLEQPDGQPDGSRSPTR